MTQKLTVIEHVKSIEDVIIEHELRDADGLTIGWIVQVGDSYAVDRGDFTAFEWAHLDLQSALMAVRLELGL